MTTTATARIEDLLDDVRDALRREYPILEGEFEAFAAECRIRHRAVDRVMCDAFDLLDAGKAPPTRIRAIREALDGEIGELDATLFRSATAFELKSGSFDAVTLLNAELELQSDVASDVSNDLRKADARGRFGDLKRDETERRGIARRVRARELAGRRYAWDDVQRRLGRVRADMTSGAAQEDAADAALDAFEYVARSPSAAAGPWPEIKPLVADAAYEALETAVQQAILARPAAGQRDLVAALLGEAGIAATAAGILHAAAARASDAIDRWASGLGPAPEPDAEEPFDAAWMLPLGVSHASVGWAAGIVSAYAEKAVQDLWGWAAGWAAAPGDKLLLIPFMEATRAWTDALPHSFALFAEGVRSNGALASIDGEFVDAIEEIFPSRAYAENGSRLKKRIVEEDGTVHRAVDDLVLIRRTLQAFVRAVSSVEDAPSRALLDEDGRREAVVAVRRHVDEIVAIASSIHGLEAMLAATPSEVAAPVTDPSFWSGMRFETDLATFRRIRIAGLSHPDDVFAAERSCDRMAGRYSTLRSAVLLATGDDWLDARRSNVEGFLRDALLFLHGPDAEDVDDVLAFRTGKPEEFGLGGTAADEARDPLRRMLARTEAMRRVVEGRLAGDDRPARDGLDVGELIRVEAIASLPDSPWLVSAQYGREVPEKADEACREVFLEHVVRPAERMIDVIEARSPRDVAQRLDATNVDRVVELCVGSADPDLRLPFEGTGRLALLVRRGCAYVEHLRKAALALPDRSAVNDTWSGFVNECRFDVAHACADDLESALNVAGRFLAHFSLDVRFSGEEGLEEDDRDLVRAVRSCVRLVEDARGAMECLRGLARPGAAGRGEEDSGPAVTPVDPVEPGRSDPLADIPLWARQASRSGARPPLARERLRIAAGLIDDVRRFSVSARAYVPTTREAQALAGDADQALDELDLDALRKMRGAFERLVAIVPLLQVCGSPDVFPPMHATAAAALAEAGPLMAPEKRERLAALLLHGTSRIASCTVGSVRRLASLLGSGAPSMGSVKAEFGLLRVMLDAVQDEVRRIADETPGFSGTLDGGLADVSKRWAWKALVELHDRVEKAIVSALWLLSSQIDPWTRGISDEAAKAWNAAASPFLDGSIPEPDDHGAERLDPALERDLAVIVDALAGDVPAGQWARLGLGPHATPDQLRKAMAARLAVNAVLLRDLVRDLRSVLGDGGRGMRSRFDRSDEFRGRLAVVARHDDVRSESFWSGVRGLFGLASHVVEKDVLDAAGRLILFEDALRKAAEDGCMALDVKASPRSSTLEVWTTQMAWVRSLKAIGNGLVDAPSGAAAVSAAPKRRSAGSPPPRPSDVRTLADAPKAPATPVRSRRPAAPAVAEARSLPLGMPFLPSNPVALSDAVDAAFPHVPGLGPTLAARILRRRMRPTIIVGPTGAGKSMLAKLALRSQGIPYATVLCSTLPESPIIGGTPKHWSTAQPALAVRTIKDRKVGNPGIVLDEIDKVGTGRHNGNLAEALLPFLSPETAAEFEDPCLQEKIDVSQVSWIATANSVANVDPALLDRMRVVNVPEPGKEHVEAHAWFAFRHMLEREEMPLEHEEPLDDFEVEFVRRQWNGRSFRGLDRFVEAIWKSREASRVRH